MSGQGVSQPESGPAGATLAVNARRPFPVLTYTFTEGLAEGREDIGPPRLIALALIRAEDEDWVRASEQLQRPLFCLLEPAEPESQIAGFTFNARVSGFRELRDRGLAAEFTSVGPITPHFLGGPERG